MLVYDSQPHRASFQIELTLPDVVAVSFEVPRGSPVCQIAQPDAQKQLFVISLWQWAYLDQLASIDDTIHVHFDENVVMDIEIGSLLSLHLSGIHAVSLSSTLMYHFDIKSSATIARSAQRSAVASISDLLEYQSKLNMAISASLVAPRSGHDDRDYDEDDDEAEAEGAGAESENSELSYISGISALSDAESIVSEVSIDNDHSSSSQQQQQQQQRISPPPQLNLHQSQASQREMLSSPSSTSLSNKGRQLGRYLKPKIFGSSVRSTSSAMTSNTATTDDLLLSNASVDDTVGYLIIQIESAKDLPPFRKSTRLGYDMDPFVTCSFSKQIFKTNKCSHTLNPIWKHQFVNLRISKYVRDLDFPIRFKLFDHDYLSFNDPVCHGDVSIMELIADDNEDVNQFDWTYKTIPLTMVPSALLKKLSKRTSSTSSPKFHPTLNIKYKFVPLETMRTLSANNFNPRETKCPNCHSYDKYNINGYKHLSICTSNVRPGWVIKKLYTTQSNASRGWYSKILAHVVYGKLKLGKNNGHIVVQDRDTGLIFEEKMSAWVKLGIRLIYKSRKKKGSKARKMIRSMSIKQGIKFDAPRSVNKIDDFIKFFGLDMSEYVREEACQYKTFNDFFARQLKPGKRPIEGRERGNEIITLMADARTIVFDSVDQSKEIWIKGRGFTVEKFLGLKKAANMDYAIVIQRLAPQDYHRVHIPFNGTIVSIRHIHGEYYTVNPMAIRSNLDVFGENVRTVVTMRTEEFGEVQMVLVGAMMVGSIVISVGVNEEVSKGDELGYFKFGGSTIVMLLDSQLCEWDGDLVNNSQKGLETLCRYGMAGGVLKGKEHYVRHKKDVIDDTLAKQIEIQVTGNRFVHDDNDVPLWDVKELSLLEDEDENLLDVVMMPSGSEDLTNLSSMSISRLGSDSPSELDM